MRRQLLTSIVLGAAGASLCVGCHHAPAAPPAALAAPPSVAQGATPTLEQVRQEKHYAAAGGRMAAMKRMRENGTLK